jgi:hypothetical protein
VKTTTLTAEAPAASERQLPDVAGDHAVGDVELRRAALGTEVVAVNPIPRPCDRLRFDPKSSLKEPSASPGSGAGRNVSESTKR